MSTNRTSRPYATPTGALSIGLYAFITVQMGCGSDTEDPDDGGGGASFTSIYNSSTFQQCAECHAPNAPGKTVGTEATQDWSTRATAYATLKTGKASGLIGNFEACNGVALIGATANQSLLVAALDEDVRENFATPSAPDCNGDNIADMTLMIGGDVPSGLLADLKSWVNAGAPDN